MEKHKSSVASKETKESKSVKKDGTKELSAKPVVVVSEMETETLSESVVKIRKRKVHLKAYRKPAMIAAGLLVLLGAAYFFRGVFVAAVVDGSPISRLSVIRELEKQAGQQALDRLVTQKLVDAEVIRKKIVIPSSDMDAEIKKIEDSVTKQGGLL
jgi:hypothetical protein